MNSSKPFLPTIKAIAVLLLLAGCTPAVASPTPSATAAPSPTAIAAPAPAEPWWNQAVFYEVFVRSFADSTSGHLAYDGIGDLAGLIEKLDYLNDGDPATSDDLGVTALWLMPTMQSPSYHGYDITDYYTVNTDYGYNADFIRLMDEAHRRGIRVVIDLVLNHTSDQHPWFIEARNDPTSARRDWYIWSESQPTYTGPWGEQVWFESPSGYYYGVFGANMPDLNYTNPAVTAEMGEVARFWLGLGADGFRLDAARYLIEEGEAQADTASTHAWWKQFRTVYKAANPQAVTVGEVAASRYAIADYLQGDELDLAFDFPLAEAVVRGISARNAPQLQSALTESYSQFGSDRSATFLSNHDMSRLMSRIAGQTDKAKLAAMLLFTAPGVPFIYYGEEIGMTGDKPDPGIRTPMQWSAEENAGFTAGSPWEAVNADYVQVNVAAQSADPDSLLSCYRDMIHLRLAHPALQSGDYAPVESGSKTLLAFLRTENAAEGAGTFSGTFGSSPEETLLVVINLGGKPASGYELALKAGNLSGVYRASLVYGGEAELPGLQSVNTAGGFDSYAPAVEIPGNGMIVIQLQAGR